MSLASGTRLGSYEILAPLGTGGMGEVFLARDTTLERDVAIKVLPAALSADPIARERFRREARAARLLTRSVVHHAGR
jgi:serine/threonine protein kinase